MRIFAIDDERAMLDELHEAIAAAEPDAEVFDFMRAKSAIEAIEDGCVPDAVFSDIELPGMNGLALASSLKTVAPDAKIVFVTAYPSYAVEAFRLHVDGFVVKPVEAARVREELDALFGPEQTARQEKLRVRCFGSFDVFFGDSPLVFSRMQAKELFAFLVDRVGGTCTWQEIAAALWENRRVKDPQSYLRVLTNDLRETLASVGMEDVLVREHGQWAVRTDLIDCDYYRMLAGDTDAMAAFQGEYMRQYSWAEVTTAKLHFMHEARGAFGREG